MDHLQVIADGGIFIQGALKSFLQWYSKCYCVASVKKMFTFKGVQEFAMLKDVQFLRL
jgi:hypothetical protein